MTDLTHRRKAILLVLAVVAAMAAAAWPGSAGAHDHRVPRAKLVSRNSHQRGRLKSFCWMTGRASTGAACAESSYSWPLRDRTRTAKAALVRIRKAQPPRELRLRRWREIDGDQAPVGDGKIVEYNLVTTTHNGDVVQEARFRLPRKPGQYYLKARGAWRDLINGQNQYANWIFHLKLR